MLTPVQLKQAAAKAALDYVLPQLASGSIIGIGTGSTSNCFISLLGQHQHRFAGTVASSEASAALLRDEGIPVFDLATLAHGAIDIYVDGADESNAKLQLIKGGGGALTREKIVAANAREFVCIADQSKWVDVLGRFPLPIEVIPMALQHVSHELAKMGGQPQLRKNVVTDNGNIILDIHGLHIDEPVELEANINQITGVVTCGLFAKRPADLLFLATNDGVTRYD